MVDCCFDKKKKKFKFKSIENFWLFRENIIIIKKNYISNNFSFELIFAEINGKINRYENGSR